MAVSAPVIGLAPGQAVAGLTVDGLVLVLVAVTVGQFSEGHAACGGVLDHRGSCS